MEEPRELKLPSGATLKIQVAPFADSKALYQAVFEELKHMKLDPLTEIDTNLYKDIFCYGLSSKKIETALMVCMKRVLYNDSKITDQTFEPIEAREDYLIVCFEVAKDNISPFMKSLYAQFGEVLGLVQKSLS